MVPMPDIIDISPLAVYIYVFIISSINPYYLYYTAAEFSALIGHKMLIIFFITAALKVVLAVLQITALYQSVAGHTFYTSAFSLT